MAVIKTGHCFPGMMWKTFLIEEGGLKGLYERRPTRVKRAVHLSPGLEEDLMTFYVNNMNGLLFNTLCMNV